MKIRSIKDVYTFTPRELAESLGMGSFVEYMPTKVDTKEDMDRIADTLLLIVNKYAFLMGVLSSLKVSIREERRADNKPLYEDLIDKKTIVENAVDILKLQQKNTVKAYHYQADG